jgi:prepilin-type N-terminal cleavage/methylation domain-containing protein
MKSTHFKFRSQTRAFTLVEMLIVVTLIALLAALTLGAYTYAMRSSKRRVTTGTFETIKLALERYNVEFGEYPQPNNSGQMMQFPPGRFAYDVSGAACLYQALTGDGFDQIRGVTSTTTGSASGSASSMSDGKVDGAAEVKNKMLVEIPQSIFTKKNSTYILIDGFGHPFQYIKAAAPTTPSTGTNSSSGSNSNTTPITINATYDLWSYGEDDANASMRSTAALNSPSVSVRWIKNW